MDKQNRRIKKKKKKESWRSRRLRKNLFHYLESQNICKTIDGVRYAFNIRECHCLLLPDRPPNKKQQQTIKKTTSKTMKNIEI